MTEQPKKNFRPDTRQVFNLVKANAASNNRNHRLQVSRTSYKSNSNDNDKSSPKPLLECLQPEPLLTSKPYEKPMSQRRRKNKPFDQENLGRKYFIDSKKQIFNFHRT